MATSFNTIHLGNFPSIDPTEGNDIAENASVLLGNYDSFVNSSVMEMSLISSANSSFYQQNNSSTFDTYSITDSDGNVTVHNFDAVASYNANVTYSDGTVSESVVVAVIQDDQGNTWLVPPADQDTDADALEAMSISGINLISVFSDQYAGLLIDRDDLEDIATVPCFTQGTIIETDRGNVAIENLSIGDSIRTKNHGLQKLRWIGSTTVPAIGKNAPIMFKSGSVGNNANLRVSPQHRMLVDNWKAEVMFGDREVFILAKHMVNGETIFVEEGGFVVYFHMMFDTHEVVFANGSSSESFHPGQASFTAFSEETREEIISLFPQLCGDFSAYGECAHYTLIKPEAKVLTSLN